MISSPETPQTDTIDARQAWMAVLAKSPCEQLEAKWNALGDIPQYRFLKEPETGLVMVQARAGGCGSRFNFGEMTMTKCIVELDGGTAGHAYIAGSDTAHAEMAAVMDALLQEPDTRDRVMADIIIPLERDQSRRKQKMQSKVAATRVDFFTLVRGEDE